MTRALEQPARSIAYIQRRGNDKESDQEGHQAGFKVQIGITQRPVSEVQQRAGGVSSS
jgi:hypothetical protein